MTDQPVLRLLLGDVVRLRRAHPCGGDTWLVDRLGADIGLRCVDLRPPRPARAAHARAPPGRLRVARRPGRDRRGRADGRPTTTARPGDGRDDRPRTGRGGGRPARRLPERRVPPALAVAGGDPDRRQHGPVRADRHRLQLDQLEHRGQPADPDVPRPGRAVLGGRRRLRRPGRPAAHPDRDEPPARRSRSSRCTSPGATWP